MRILGQLHVYLSVFTFHNGVFSQTISQAAVTNQFVVTFVTTLMTIVIVPVHINTFIPSTTVLMIQCGSDITISNVPTSLITDIIATLTKFDLSTTTTTTVLSDGAVLCNPSSACAAGQTGGYTAGGGVGNGGAGAGDGSGNSGQTSLGAGFGNGGSGNSGTGFMGSGIVPTTIASCMFQKPTVIGIDLSTFMADPARATTTTNSQILFVSESAQSLRTDAALLGSLTTLSFLLPSTGLGFTTSILSTPRTSSSQSVTNSVLSSSQNFAAQIFSTLSITSLGFQSSTISAISIISPTQTSSQKSSQGTSSSSLSSSRTASAACSTVCATNLPSACSALSPISGLALNAAIPLCKTELGSYASGDAGLCLATNIDALSLGTNITTCLSTALSTRCISVLPGPCLALSSDNGLILSSDIPLCVTALGPFVVGSAATCLDTTSITSNSIGTSVVSCLFGALGLQPNPASSCIPPMTMMSTVTSSAINSLTSGNTNTLIFIGPTTLLLSFTSSVQAALPPIMTTASSLSSQFPRQLSSSFSSQSITLLTSQLSTLMTQSTMIWTTQFSATQTSSAWVTYLA
ncbi:hypothetical protein BP6252_12903 [Coleophoma cylindrospora]|uniref:Uncharacterized protein n=1 Tax=Coleophoma cylindrospora TaxID=1849047 RepID=A0A3D8QD88_9HELO|nr:hypothetical protein BP6252_12903 [Coleophoma cylindrospora]